MQVVSEVRQTAMTPRRTRRRLLQITFILLVLLPSLIGSVYFLLLASDRFVAGAGFTVRGVEARGGGDLLGAVTGLASSGSTSSDSFVLLQYLKSRDLIESLERELPFRAMYSGEAVDIFSRLDSSAAIEKVVEYWQRRIRTSYDANSGIILLEVEAFSPSDALTITSHVLDHARTLINELSQQARADAVRYAEDEVKRSESRLKSSLEAIRAFREGRSSLDPSGAARMEMELIASLEKQRSELSARIDALGSSIAENSPALRALRRQADAIQRQIDERSATRREAGKESEALPGQMAEYDELDVEKTFAQQSYLSSLSSLQTARIEADRRQRYLAVFSNPVEPQYPLYPRRWLSCVMLVIGLSVVWGIGVLIVYSVRDHVA